VENTTPCQLQRQHPLGPVQLLVRYDDGVATLVVERNEGGAPLLQLACDVRGARLRCGAAAPRDFPARRDTIGQALSAARSQLPNWLAEAGLGAEAIAQIGSDALAAALTELEPALRNPPVDLEALEVGRLHQRISEKWAEHPDPDVIACWVAEMDYPLAAPIRRVLEEALAFDDVGYPIAPRDTGLLETFAERMQASYGWAAPPERGEVLSDVVQGMYLSLLAYTAPGDTVAVQPPIYPPFLGVVRDTGRELFANPLERSRSGRYEIDFDALARAPQQTRVLLLCNPHNPSGRAFERAELEALAQLALQRDWIVVSDEIHQDLVHDGRTHIPFAAVAPEVGARTVTLTSATKAFNIPGLRCAVGHFGSTELQRRFAAAVPRHARGGIGLLGIYATIAAWRHAQPWLDAVRAHVEANRDFAAAFLRSRCPDVRFALPEATYLLWLDCSALDLPSTPARFLLEKGRIALSDGHHFGAGYDAFCRLNLATSRAILREVLERFAAALERR